MLGKPGMFAVTALLIGAGTAQAASITFWDNGSNNNTSGLPSIAATWVLASETDCIGPCVVSLNVTFGPGSAYDGAYLESFQFNVAQANLNLGNDSGGFSDGIKLTSTSAGLQSDWAMVAGGLSEGADCNPANQSSQNGCGNYIGASNGGIDGQGPIIAPGTSWSWNFEVDFLDTFSSFTTGNVRANFVLRDGTNRIFSPSGEISCVATDCEPITAVPEPATLFLLGSGVVLATRQLRRKP